MIGEVDASRGNTSSKVLGIGQVGAVVIAMIGLQHLQCQVGLGKGWVGACDTIGQSHPVEGGDIVLFHGLDEVIDKLEHQVLAYIIVCLAFACIHIAGAPFTNNDWNFVDAQVDLSKYAGKKITLGFKYTSKEAGAATWEIKTLSIQ